MEIAGEAFNALPIQETFTGVVAALLANDKETVTAANNAGDGALGITDHNLDEEFIDGDVDRFAILRLMTTFSFRQPLRLPTTATW